MRQQGKIFSCEVPLGDYERNIGEMLRDRAERFANQPMVLERAPGAPEFQSFTWKETYQEIRRVGAALIKEGVSPGDRVAILSHNSREMLISVLAIQSIGAISVPIFFGYFPEQVQFIINHSGAKVLIAADTTQVAKTGEPEDVKRLEKIFVVEEFSSKNSDPRRKPFSSLIEQEPEADILKKHLADTNPDDTCMIMYTSGTTGQPKGVELTHRNVLSQHQGLSQVWKVGPKDRFLCYLPWHHCFGGIFEFFMAFYNGVPLAIDSSRGKDLDLLIENWKLIKPTVYFSVPMIYQLLVTEMEQDVSLKKTFFHSELRCVFTAAAPLPPGIYKVFKDLGVKVHEGWGLTEATPDITITRHEKDYASGNVGEVLPGVEITLNDEGEVLARGPNVMKGYYQNPESTNKALDSDGWLHTGDLGEIDENGLRIVGRADGVFKLVNGEKVPSVQIEGQLISCSKYIDRAVAIGRGHEYVTAIVFLNEKNLHLWAKEKNLQINKLTDFLQTDPVRALFLEDIRQANLQLDTKFYRVRRVFICPQPPTLERGELTPTNKVCRKRVMENHADIIHEMYHGVNGEPSKRCVTV